MPATSAVVSVLVLEALVLDSVELGAGVAKTVTVLHGVELVEVCMARDGRFSSCGYMACDIVVVGEVVINKSIKDRFGRR